MLNGLLKGFKTRVFRAESRLFFSRPLPEEAFVKIITKCLWPSFIIQT